MICAYLASMFMSFFDMLCCAMKNELLASLVELATFWISMSSERSAEDMRRVRWIEFFTLLFYFLSLIVYSIYETSCVLRIRNSLSRMRLTKMFNKSFEP